MYVTLVWPLFANCVSAFNRCRSLWSGIGFRHILIQVTKSASDDFYLGKIVSLSWKICQIQSLFMWWKVLSQTLFNKSKIQYHILKSHVIDATTSESNRVTDKKLNCITNTWVIFSNYAHFNNPYVLPRSVTSKYHFLKSNHTDKHL